MVAPPEVLEAPANWESLTRSERAELGRRLRRLGWTYSEVMEVLPVGKATLSSWCQVIRLTDDQVDAIKARRPPGMRTGVPVDTQRKRRLEVEAMQQQAKADVQNLMDKPLWVAGTVMYWAEGTKCKRILELVNTDPRTLELFVAWARQFHNPDARFVLSLHLHQGNIEAAAQAFWREALDLPEARFTKTFVKPAGTGHRKNKYAHGVCRVQMSCSTNPWWRTMAWIDELSRRLTIIPLVNSERVAGATGSATDS